MAATNLHDAIVPSRVRKTANLIGGFGDQLRVSEFIYVTHVNLKREYSSNRANYA
jgi:hypothetical protein